MIIGVTEVDFLYLYIEEWAISFTLIAIAKTTNI
jgi:hypothetical protein